MQLVASASPTTSPDLGRLFTNDAKYDIGTTPLLSGSADQSIIPALRAQIERAERISRAGALSWGIDDLAGVADRLISTDGAVRIQTIEIEEERKLAARNFAEIFAPASDDFLPVIDENPRRTQSAAGDMNAWRAEPRDQSTFAVAPLPAAESTVRSVAPKDEDAVGANLVRPLAENPFVGRLGARALGVSGVPTAFTGGFSDSGRFFAESGAVAQLPSVLMFGSNQPLTGNRTFAAPSLTAAGLVSPGNSPGKIIIEGDFTLLSSSILLIELEGTATGIDYDIVSVGGTATLGGARLDLTLLGAFQSRVQPTDTFSVLLAGTGANGGQLVGTFGNIANGGRLLTTDGLGSFQVNYGPNSAFAVKNVVLSNFVAVPEPSTWMLMGGGAVAMAIALRRRKS